MEKENQPQSHLYLRDNYFKDQVMVLTGGTSRMLYQVAEDFMTLGGHVALLSRRPEELDKVSQDLRKKTKGKAKGYKINLKESQDVFRVVEEIIKDFGRIDILVNGAAGNFLADAESLSLNGFRTVLEIDTVGTFMMSKAVYSKWMKKNGGRIVNISASLHHLGTLLQAHASAAKAAVDALTKTLALEWGPKGVRVNGVAPGPIEGTEGLSRLGDYTTVGSKKNLEKSKEAPKKNALDNLIEMIPLGRLGTRNDVSDAVLFLASDASKYVTGQTILVDGGALAMSPNWIQYVPDFMKAWRAKF